MNELSAYSGKTVLVTGHTGFKGGWLCLWLASLGAKAVGYSLEPPSDPNLFTAVGIKGQVTHLHGDITDLDTLTAAMGQHRPDAVFHLAAQPLVRRSYDDPVGTYESNVMGTVKVMEAVRRAAPKAFVNITSDKCYRNEEWCWGYRESDPFGGADPYSSSKGCAELVFAAYVHSYFAPDKYGDTHQTLCGSVRAGNVIGGGDWGADRLLPDCMRAFSAGEQVTLRYPSAIRPWQHVLEPLYGYLLLGAKLLGGDRSLAGGWNFGPSDTKTWTVEDVVRLAASAWGGASYTVAAAPHRHEAHWLKLDCSRARQLLGWEPLWEATEAIARSVEWYRRFYDGDSPDRMLDFTLSQIREYERLLSTKTL